MPRPGAWADRNREKLREYSRAYRKAHPEYFKAYETKHRFKMMILRKIWRRRTQKKYGDYYTREQRNEYSRMWRAKKKQEKEWQNTYLRSLTPNTTTDT